MSLLVIEIVLKHMFYGLIRLWRLPVSKGQTQPTALKPEKKPEK